MPQIIGINQAKASNTQNYIINGNFDFWQRNTSITSTTNASFYTADRVLCYSSVTAARSLTSSRSTDVPTFAQSNFNSTYSFMHTNNTAIASFDTNNYYLPFTYRMEGNDFSKIHKKTVTFSFWFKASIAGTYSFSIRNQAYNRSYVTSFTVNVANTWEYKTKTILLDQSGTWVLDSNQGPEINIAGIGGSAYQTSTLDTWQAANVFQASTATNYSTTAGSSFQVSQFQVNEGAVAAAFSLYGKEYENELAACQRYYEKSYNLDVLPGTASASAGAVVPNYTNTTITNNAGFYNVIYRVAKRNATPAPTVYGFQGGSGKVSNSGGTDLAAGSGNSTFSGSTGFRVTNQSGGSIGPTEFIFHWVSDAEL